MYGHIQNLFIFWNSSTNKVSVFTTTTGFPVAVGFYSLWGQKKVAGLSHSGQVWIESAVRKEGKSERKNKDDVLNYDALMPRNSLYFLQVGRGQTT